MDNPEQPNQIARSFAFFFYAFCVFVGIRVWIEVVASGDKSAIIATAVITFLIVCCVCSRYRRYRRQMEMRNRRRVVGGMDMFELFARHRGILEAEGINVHGGLTQAAIDKLPNVVYKADGLYMAHPITNTDDDHVRLEEGTLSPPGGSSSSGDKNYKTLSSAPSVGDSKEMPEKIITNHNDVSSCPICLNDFILDEVLLFLPKCGHAYHRACISEWLVNHNSCPLCKHEVIAMPALPENDPLIVNVDGHNHNNNNNLINNANRPIVMVDEGGIAILRLPNQQGVGIYFIDNHNVNNNNNNAASRNTGSASRPSLANESEPLNGDSSSSAAAPANELI